MRKAVRAVAIGAVWGVVAGLFATTPATAETTLKARLVKKIDLARLHPSSSDAAGITYLPSSGRFLFSDCNIDELLDYEGVNLWQISSSGSVQSTGATKRYSNEPTGVSWDERSSTLFVSDDDKLRIFSVRAGKDGKIGTSDDTTSSFSTSAFSGDPEDVTYDPDGDALFIVDGVGAEVYRVAGSGGVFDGGSVTHFDVAHLGAHDPEGIVYDKGRKSLFVLDHGAKKVWEVDTSGGLRTTISVSAASGSGQLAGLVIAPSSKGSGMSFWVVDRGVNNALTIAPNDGKLFELAVDLPIGKALPATTSAPDPQVSPAAPAQGPGSAPPAGGAANPAAAGAGYRLAAGDGNVFAYGDAPFKGSAGGLRLAKPIVATSSTPSGQGYWLVATDGGIFSYGDAGFFGSTGNLRLVRPIVGMAPTPSGKGYWLVASDGGIFAYGDAAFFGSTGAIRLAQPIVGMASTPSGRGYWLVASDGGIFAFGDAAFVGSTGSVRLTRPIAGMAATPSGRGYWLVASDGGIFAFGDAPFLGSTGALRLMQPIVGMAPTDSGRGYWLVASDGGIFAFGDAPFLGSTGALKPLRSIVGLAAR